MKDYDIEEGIKIEDVIKNEKVLWTLKPNKKAYIYNKTFSFEMIFGIISIMNCILFLLVFFGGTELKYFGILGMLFFIFPIIKYCDDLLKIKDLWKNEEYCITEKRIIIKTGIVQMKVVSIYYKDITDIILEKGLINSFFNVGNIKIMKYDYETPEELKKDSEYIEPYDQMICLNRPYDVYSYLLRFISDKQEQK